MTTVGAKPRSRARRNERPSDSRSRSVFCTELGWVGLVIGPDGVERVFFDCESEAQASVLVSEWKPSQKRGRRPSTSQDTLASEAIAPAALSHEVESKLVDFALGAQADLNSIPIAVSHLTPFQRAVVTACRKIEYGQTRSYGELAAEAGSPRAARAVGTVMANNNVPLIVPCHRVVASQGLIGGFSSRRGVGMKQRLLALERAYP